MQQPNCWGFHHNQHQCPADRRMLCKNCGRKDVEMWYCPRFRDGYRTHKYRRVEPINKKTSREAAEASEGRKKTHSEPMTSGSVVAQLLPTVSAETFVPGIATNSMEVDLGESRTGATISRPMEDPRQTHLHHQSKHHWTQVGNCGYLRSSGTWKHTPRRPGTGFSGACIPSNTSSC